MKQYQESSLLPVSEEIAWERAIFRSAADRIVERFGYSEWKRVELMRTLESNFNSAIEAGKTFEEAIREMEALVSNVLTGAQSAI